MPPTSPLGRWIRQYRRTYYQRLADRLEALLRSLDHDPEVTLDGDHLCFAGHRIHCPTAAELVRKHT
jgi:hypothetical protein